jgi:hypothetical protein
MLSEGPTRNAVPAEIHFGETHQTCMIAAGEMTTSPCVDAGASGVGISSEIAAATVRNAIYYAFGM